MNDTVHSAGVTDEKAPEKPASEASEKPRTESTWSSDTWVTAIFWTLVVLGGIWFYFYEPYVDILLDVAAQPERVSGSVSFEGQPVKTGVVRVAVSDASTRRYLASTTLQLDSAGRFATSAASGPLGIEANSQTSRVTRPLRVSAQFTGLFQPEKAADEKASPKARALTGETTVYINSAAPLGKRFLWGLSIVFGVLLVLQLWVFTGDLGQRKARTLFVLMYFFTFWALALPLVVSLIVAQNQYLVDSMENSPLGLIRAKTTALAEPQWLINIGGVKKLSPITVNRVEEGRPVAVPLSAAASANAASAPQTVVVATAEASAAADEAGITIQGGVTVPFFMVILAMFGAAINMTLQVPTIQRSYEDVMSDARASATWNPFTTTWRLIRGQTQPDEGKVVPRETAGDIRRNLIENYMYLLSAPLLAVGVYYLLQVLATQVTQPVLVLMALATGLVSKAVIGGIIDFAESRLLSAKRREALAGGSTPREAVDERTAAPVLAKDPKEGKKPAHPEKPSASDAAGSPEHVGGPVSEAGKG